MRVTSFRTGGRASYGVVVDGGIVDVGAGLGGTYETLRDVLEGAALSELEKMAAGKAADRRIKDVTLLPPIPNPDKIILVGLNYALHVQETGRADSEYPALFTRFANTQVGHDQPLVKPRVSDSFDYEGELAVVIGKGGRHIPAKNAYDHIAGYACYNDGSVRDWQGHTHQFTPGKNFPATGGFGPWMVSRDEIPDPAKLTLITRLNGQQMQKAGVDQLIFDIPYLINYISTFTDLVPGDVISTGTPGGVGFKRNPPVFMKPGDTVEVEIDGIGTLVNPVVAE